MNKSIIPTARSLTTLFTENDPNAYTTGLKALILNDYPETIAPLIDNIKVALQKVELEIREFGPENIKDIGHRFDKIEFYLDELIRKFKKPTS